MDLLEKNQYHAALAITRTWQGTSRRTRFFWLAQNDDNRKSKNHKNEDNN